ncbi:hypothetical protein [Terrihalobacillus insolitus]|uniref:hypothetical protein n=1 Tax=Terrihalobacillus insolitus TaxID=2950438 RepID=UPI002341D9C1|nr:hypothetical protein [Terrihalobacillus insolitus]MDC3413949.1 hypothetical protein [Terrihalobacillus insolitus]
MKKPFSIRVEPYVINRYRALSTVLNVDGAKLLAELIDEKEKDLSKDQRDAYDALLKIWKEEDAK